VQRNIASGFEDSYRRHLAVEQRRAVLDTIAHELTPDTTLGDIVDAAHDLGWAEGLGELCLSDLAIALFGEAAPEPPAAPAAPQVELDLQSDDDDVDDDELDDDEEDEAEAEAEAEEDEPARGRKPSSLDRAVDRIEKTLAAARKVRSKKAAKVATKKVARASKPAPVPVKLAKGKAAAKAAPVKATPVKATPVKAVKAGHVPIDEDDEDDDTEAMSLDQAAKLLVPLVRKLREATMQDLEEQTKMGRRKLRFHIGQLVKHGKLRRHGMGRGTCYTVK
jgi:hypothetical protein